MAAISAGAARWCSQKRDRLAFFSPKGFGGNGASGERGGEVSDDRMGAERPYVSCNVSCAVPFLFHESCDRPTTEKLKSLFSACMCSRSEVTLDVQNTSTHPSCVISGPPVLCLNQS